MGETVNSSVIVRGSSTGVPEDIIMEEIVPRFPIKSLCRFKSVSKQWNNFITHHNPHFAHRHHFHTSKDLSTSTYFFNNSIERVISRTNDPHHHFKMSDPFFIEGFCSIRGSVNGLLFGFLSNRDIFICNPITKHVVSVPNPKRLFYIALVVDTHNNDENINPLSGFKIVAMNDNFDDYWLGFEVYSWKANEWRESDAEVQVRLCQSGDGIRANNPIYAGGKVYWSCVRQIVWFDVEKDNAGSIQCPGTNDNFIFVDGGCGYSEIGVCGGVLSYSVLTREGNIEVWSLKCSRGVNDVEEFEWAKRISISLGEIFRENWNDLLSKFFIDKKKTNTPEKALSFTVKKRPILPLPYLDGEMVWFLIDFPYKEYCQEKLFFINIRSREMKLLDGKFQFPQYLFSASFLCCPT